MLVGFLFQKRVATKKKKKNNGSQDFRHQKRKTFLKQMEKDPGQLEHVRLQLDEIASKEVILFDVSAPSKMKQICQHSTSVGSRPMCSIDGKSYQVAQE